MAKSAMLLPRVSDVPPSGRRSCQSPELATASESQLYLESSYTEKPLTISISAAMYARLISFANRNQQNVHQSTIRVHKFPPNFFSSIATDPSSKDANLVDDIRGSASSTGRGDRVNAVKSSTTSSSSGGSGDNGGDMASFVAETAKQGAVKAVETGLDIGEMAKKTLDNVWDVTKDTSHKIKEAVAGDREESKRVEDVPVTDHFVDDLRKRADGYDLKKK